MTSFARSFHVQACQGIARFGVVEILGSFPTIHVVALGAFVAKLPLVRVRVAWRAVWRLPEKGFAEVLHLDEFAIHGKHVGRSVTLFACEVGVLAFQFVAGGFVIEFLQ